MAVCRWNASEVEPLVVEASGSGRVLQMAVIAVGMAHNGQQHISLPLLMAKALIEQIAGAGGVWSGADEQAGVAGLMICEWMARHDGSAGAQVLARAAEVGQWHGGRSTVALPSDAALEGFVPLAAIHASLVFESRPRTAAERRLLILGRLLGVAQPPRRDETMRAMGRQRLQVRTVPSSRQPCAGSTVAMHMHRRPRYSVWNCKSKHRLTRGLLLAWRSL